MERISWYILMLAIMQIITRNSVRHSSVTFAITVSFPLIRLLHYARFLFLQTRRSWNKWHTNAQYEIDDQHFRFSFPLFFFYSSLLLYWEMAQNLNFAENASRALIKSRIDGSPRGSRENSSSRALRLRQEARRDADIRSGRERPFSSVARHVGVRFYPRRARVHFLINLLKRTS